MLFTTFSGVIWSGGTNDHGAALQLAIWEVYDTDGDITLGNFSARVSTRI